MSKEQKPRKKKEKPFDVWQEYEGKKYRCCISLEKIRNDIISEYDTWILGELKEVKMFLGSYIDDFAIYDAIDQLIKKVKDNG